MSSRKWGESFLKSGLPLEHIVAVTLKSMRWHVEAHEEYQRAEGPAEPWFELDLFASSPATNQDTELGLLVETKYHDTSRFWMFLPCEDDAGWVHDDAMLNCGPLQTLTKPHSRSMAKLAPLSTIGAVLSQDGQKQENAIYTAVQQLVNAYVPYGVASRLFDYNFTVVEDADNPFWVTALVPVIVTNATLFRLRPTVLSLDEIRNASAPAEIADEVEWTWCRVTPSSATVSANRACVEAYDNPHAHVAEDDPFYGDALFNRLQDFVYRPHWVAIVNDKALRNAVTSLETAFRGLKTRPISDAFEPPRRKGRPRGTSTKPHRQ